MSTREAVKRNSSSYERVLSVGNPDFDKKKLPDLADISESTDEARVISGYYHDPKILLEKGATKSAFLNAVKDYEVINFASHYVINTASPSLSQLVMARISDNDSDNFLTNAELMREKLPLAKLVVLSACQTGAEGDFKGEGSVGLTRTFLALGVPLVVASSWPVDSKATAELIKKFHYYRKLKNLSSVHALRQAQLDMIDAAGGKFSDPYYWAAFAAFGGYAEF
jgi:CHAT domain-containing protein